jgi:radical SAM protein with 4Fe4S-binding SPASM domain
MSNEKTVADFYNSGFDYNVRAPYFIDRTELTADQWHRLTDSKTFCMLPWVHMHAFPDGRVYPCCFSDYWHPLGDLRKNTMREVWNQEAYKELRANMMADRPSKQCTKCYEQENNGAFSLRNDSNRNYGHLVSEVDKTLPDGTLEDFKIRYWDVRFSNLCNMRCRTCGPIFSSNWYNDHVKMYKRVPDVLGRDMARIEYTAGDEDAMLAQMEEHIPYLEQVYFAGGEPLIMKEHYYLLEKLIEYGKTDVRIQYNTNFSEMRYKDKHVFDYWKHFKNVSVGASLDASGARAELMRKGTKWQQTVDNRKRMMEELPHVDFYVSCTYSIMNVLHALDFHKEWVDLGFIKAKDWNVNALHSSEWLRIDALPEKFKNDVVIPAYQKHIEWLSPQDDLKRATTGYQSLINMMLADDKSHLMPSFRRETMKLDAIRNERFWEVFPELRSIK